MIALALPLLAATGLVPDREPGAPWARFETANGPVFYDPVVTDEDGEKIIRLLDRAETPATSDVILHLSVACPPRRAMIVRLTSVKTGEVTQIAPENREPADPGDPVMGRLLDFVCDGKLLQ